MMPNTDNKVRIDKTINLGHMISLFGFVLLMIANWSMMDKRVVVLEEARIAQKERDITRDQSSREKFQEVREAIVDLKNSVEKVADKINVR